MSTMALKRLVDAGELLHLARGVYMLRDAEFGEHLSFAEVTARAPHTLICLLSALTFHHLSDEAPFEIWTAYERGKARPDVKELPVRLFCFSPRSFCYGVDVHQIEGVSVRITSPAKTVADCFKFRNQIGLDVCLAALKDYLYERKGSREVLEEAARVCRVANVMRPYLEVMQ